MKLLVVRYIDSYEPYEATMYLAIVRDRLGIASAVMAWLRKRKILVTVPAWYAACYGGHLFDPACLSGLSSGAVDIVRTRFATEFALPETEKAIAEPYFGRLHNAWFDSWNEVHEELTVEAVQSGQPRSDELRRQLYHLIVERRGEAATKEHNLAAERCQAREAKIRAEIAALDYPELHREVEVVVYQDIEEGFHFPTSIEIVDVDVI